MDLYHPGDVIIYTTPDGDERLGLVDSLSPWTGRITVIIQGVYDTDGSLDTSYPEVGSEDAFIPADEHKIKFFYNV